MQSAIMEKLSNMGSVAKEKLKICRAKLDEKVEKASVKTVEGRKIAEERRKATEAKAKQELHEAKARHAAHKLRTRKKSNVHGGHLHHQPPVEGGAATHLGGANVPAYPIPSQDYYPGHKI